nr:peptidylprolyl isomerase [Sphingomonas jatrophae]
MNSVALPLAALLAFQAAAQPAAAPAPARSSAEIVAAAPASAWARVPDDALLVMDLANGATVLIALAPDFAPAHVRNIRALAMARWWDGTSINRVQDNYVVQWGDATEKKPLPPTLKLPVAMAYERPLAGLDFRPMPYRDVFARQVGHVGTWPVAVEGGAAWLPHCYGMVGVGRNEAPDTGSGAELYAVIGQAPRHLDRNIAVVGRVVEGMEHLAALPRGTGALGFYEQPAQRIGVTRVRLAADLPAKERPAVEIMRAGTPDLDAWLTTRANRKDSFFIRPAGALDICNALPPARRVPAR